MANYTVNQAQQVLSDTNPVPTVGPPTSGTPTTGGGGGGTTATQDNSGYDTSLPPTDPGNAQWLRDHGFDPSTFGKTPAPQLPPGWVENPVTGGLIPPTGDPNGGPGIPIGGYFDVGGSVYRWNGKGSWSPATVAETRAYWAEHPNGQSYNAKQGLFEGNGTGVDGGATAAASGQGGAGGAGGSYATSQAYLQGQQALQAQRDAEAIREFDLNRQASDIQNRATVGQGALNFANTLATGQYNRALDPGNYPAYLAASAGLPLGTGSPISALIGAGTQIQSPEGANPLADPRVLQDYNEMLDYGRPQSLSTVQSIANQNGGQLPQAFYDYTHTQAPTAGLPAAPPTPAYAHGGAQMLHAPVVGIPQHQVMPGQTPLFLAGEAGPEKLSFQPVHAHASGGMPVPHQHVGGHAAHEHMGPVIRYADGGTVIAGISPTVHQLQSAWNAYHPNDLHPDNTFTPAEGTAISLGKALQPLGYVPSYLTQQLLQGRTPTPGSLDEATMNRLPPSLRALLQAQIQSSVGNAGLQDYNFQLQQNALPGLGTSAPSTVYG